MYKGLFLIPILILSGCDKPKPIKPFTPYCDVQSYQDHFWSVWHSSETDTNTAVDLSTKAEGEVMCKTFLKPMSDEGPKTIETIGTK